jgi:signal transduction histidine kinase
MKIAPLPKDENNRIQNLNSYQIVDTDFEEDYDEIAKLASFICNTPIALISLIDSDRQWFKSKVGLDVRETSRDYAFCSHAILNKNDILIVRDALEDDRFRDNPLVLDTPNIRFYAGAPLISKDGFSLGTICAIDKIPRDLSEDQLNALKVLSKHVIKLLELKKSYYLIQKYSSELSELNSSKDKFLSILSHDIKSPFISILGFSEILNTEMDDLTKEETKDMVEKIYSTSKDTYKFIENLLHWSLLESGKMEVQPENIKLNELVSSVISLLSGFGEQKKIALINNIPDDLFIFADRNMIFSLSQNLISNAIKFTSSGGNITAQAKSLNDSVEIKITDTGIGIEKVKLNSLFELKSKDSTKGTSGELGTGFGLVLCKQFVKENKGHISVESELGKGTIFTILLPQAKNI